MVIAAAQFMSLVLLANPLGASTQYAIVASSILKRVDPKWRTRASACNAVPTVTADSDWSDAITRLLNTAGVVAGAFVSAKLGGALVNSAAFAATPQSWVMDEGTKAFVGGALLLLGSRIGDGCTSGHGISGVAALSTASAVSVASMFAGAMIVANLIY
ncbi:hypothetical protein BJ742DRAFT_834175 [Cladochytrium replicatum]|nr:hypothetical protein BJ742DRAFT_834175 [Cladochytrium replicatum]